MKPIVSPPAGGDQNRGRALLVVGGFCLGLASILVILRMVVRGFIKHILWWDDFCIVLALVCHWIIWDTAFY